MKADLLTAIGETYQQIGVFDGGVRVHQEALRIREAELGPDHPKTLSSIANLAALH